MEMQTILAFDYGTYKTGLAIGNTLTFQARPLTTINHDALKPDFDMIKSIINEWTPNKLLVGVPVGLNGQENDFCRSCRKFANRLHYHFNLDIILYDESLSSAEAEAALKRGDTEFRKKVKSFNQKNQQKLRDQVAAQIILQRYLSDLSIGRDNQLTK